MTRKDKRDRPSRGQDQSGAETRTGIMEGVPQLIYGDNSNLRDVERCLSNRAIYEFGVHLGACIELLEYRMPPEVVFDRARIKDKDDIVYKKVIETRVVKREEAIARAEDSKPKLYHAILSILSSEGEEAVRKHKNFKTKAEDPKDPLELWRVVRETHMVPSNNPDVDTVKMQCRYKYASIKMSDYETIASFKPRFDFIRKASVDAGNQESEPLDTAMDFLQALNDKQYGDFRVNLLNDKTAGVGNFPSNLEEMYIRASSFLVNNGSGSHLGGDFRAVYTSLSASGAWRGGRGGRGDDRRASGRGRGDRSGNGGRGGRGRSEAKQKTSRTEEARAETRKCHLCGEVGHLQRACPLTIEDNNSVEEEPATKKKKKGFVAVKIAGVSILQAVKKRALAGPQDVCLNKHLVVLDNAANYSLFRNHRLLGKLRAPADDDGIYGIDGEALACASVGAL
jgi:hypothetical protein